MCQASSFEQVIDAYARLLRKANDDKGYHNIFKTTDFMSTLLRMNPVSKSYEGFR